jgi:hypothetical protein
MPSLLWPKTPCLFTSNFGVAAIRIAAEKSCQSNACVPIGALCTSCLYAIRTAPPIGYTRGHNEPPPPSTTRAPCWPRRMRNAAVPMIWVKFACVMWLFAGALCATLRLGQPGASLAGMPGILAAPVLGVWLLAIAALSGTARTQWLEIVLGQTAAVCPITIALLGTPVFLAGLWAMQGLAPTRLRLTGACVGLLAGAAGACVYALHCPELAAPFLGTWYVLGMALLTALGVLIGPRVLRWEPEQGPPSDVGPGDQQVLQASRP